MLMDLSFARLLVMGDPLGPLAMRAGPTLVTVERVKFVGETVPPGVTDCPEKGVTRGPGDTPILGTQNSGGSIENSMYAHPTGGCLVHEQNPTEPQGYI